MTKHSHISGAPLSVPAEGAANSQIAEAGRAGNLRTFSDRRAPCPWHDATTADSCSDCWGGFVDVACETCGHVKPLNSANECEKCTDASNLPVELYNLKYNLVPPSGWALAERAAVSK